MGRDDFSFEIFLKSPFEIWKDDFGLKKNLSIHPPSLVAKTTIYL